MSELDLLRGLGDEILPQPFDALRETARRRTRRTRAASALAAAVVVGVIGAAAFLTGTNDESAPDPVVPPQRDAERPMTYAEGSAIHYGDRVVTAPGAVVELDLTSDSREPS